ncbi:MAG: ABC transporter ATP-binding protein [Cyanobacteria bacterium J083]|nr:MAG: ABC transporter ATP-binding protein [Cyanobacteria bacterium J083]
MNQKTILSLENVSKKFDSHLAVDSVSFTLQRGELLGLLGPSGCGKTTLLRIIAGFEQIDQGKVYLGGNLVSSPSCWLPPEQRRTGMVFQDYALFPHLNIAENIAFGLKRKKLSGKRLNNQQIKQRIAEVLALVGLTPLAKRYPHELSGGQQQRIALARALAPQPDLILLDEPLSNLDVQVRHRLREEIRCILKAAGTSAIFVTHDQEEALAICDQIGVMRQGKLEQIGTPEAIYTQPASRFVAEFVTQANFLTAQRNGSRWCTEIGDFDLSNTELSNCDQAELMVREEDIVMIPDELTTVIIRERQFLGREYRYCDQAELMVREEDIVIIPDERAAVIVRDRQFLGREYRYCLETSSGKRLHARTDISTRVDIGKKVNLSVPTQSLKVFPLSS